MNKEQPTDWPGGKNPLAGRWFLPIIEKIEAFENTHRPFEFMDLSLGDAAPDWIKRCLIDTAKSARVGRCNPQNTAGNRKDWRSLA